MRFFVKRDGRHVQVTEEEYAAHQAERAKLAAPPTPSAIPPAMVFPVSPAAQPAQPSLLTKAQRLAIALAKWSRAGFPVVPYLQRQRRRAICLACPAYDRERFGGLGACRDPRCGCTSIKRWLPTERCPQNRWPT